LQIVGFRWSGIRVYSGSHDTLIEENTIGGNRNDAIRIRGSDISRTRILSNYLGTGTDGVTPNGNRLYGVQIANGAVDTLIRGNTIAYNGLDGVRILGEGTERHTITRNNITANGARGIDNIDEGNRELVPPEILTVTTALIQGRAQPGAIVELYTDLFFEGGEFLVHTTADDDGMFTAALTTSPTYPLVTATSTDEAGNTSEFAAFCALAGLDVQRIWPYCTLGPSPASSPFGPRQMASEEHRYDFHRGVDLPAPLWTPFYAIADGTVTEVVTKANMDGTIQIAHSGGYCSRYRHVAEPLVAVGQTVQQGARIGLTGKSTSDFSHTHFEIRRERCGYEKYAENPFGEMPYEDENDYRVEIGPVSVDPADPDNPTTVSLSVTGARQELDLNAFAVTAGGLERAINWNALNRERTPAPNNEEPDVLDHPYQDGICIMPAKFKASSDEYQIDLVFHKGLGPSTSVISARVTDARGYSAIEATQPSDDLLLSPALVTATATTPTGRWVTHTHTLTNVCVVSRTFALSATSAQSWQVRVAPKAVSLQPGEGATFTTSISVPDLDAGKVGTTDCVVVDAGADDCSYVKVEIKGRQRVLPGQTLKLMAQVTPPDVGRTLSYEWSLEGLQYAITNTAFYSWPTSGVYNVVVTATNGYRALNDSLPIAVAHYAFLPLILDNYETQE
jgi:murein DD-endopeptidase MepM/ murein hydrolase activator NlpD